MSLSELCYKSITDGLQVVIHERSTQDSLLISLVKRIVAVAALTLFIIPILSIGTISWILEKAISWIYSGTEDNLIPLVPPQLLPLINEPIPELTEEERLIPLKPNILLSKPYKQVFDRYQDPKIKDQAISAAIFLISIAKPEETGSIIPTLKMVDFSKNKFEVNLLDSFKIFFEKTLNIKFNDSIEKAKKIALESLSRLEGLQFHGTHGRHVDSIINHGLSVDHGGKNEKADRIHKIGVEALGYPQRGYGILGYRYADCIQVDGKNKVFFSKGTLDTVDYARTAPEWFFCFISGQICEGNSNFYRNRDKQSIVKLLEVKLKQWQICDNSTRQNLENARPLTNAEAQEIRDFFEETWEYYKENSPVVFRIILPKDRNEISHVEDFENRLVEEKKLEIRTSNLYNSARNLSTSEQNKKLDEMNIQKNEIARINRTWSSLLYSYSIGSNTSINKTIPSSRLFPIYLPI